MVSLFLLGAFIGSGTCFTLDLLAQNKLLKEELNKLKPKEEEKKEEEQNNE